VLLDREQELSIALAACRRATEGRGSVLVVHGAAGIGKTALLDATAAQVDGLVVRTTAVEAEQSLAFATLQALLWPLRDRFDELEVGQAELLRGVVRAGPALDSSLFAVGAATLALLSVVAAEELVVVVDDAQWADRASQEALCFVGRRIANEHIAVLVGVREGEPCLLADERSFTRLELGPLEPDAARELLAASAPTEVAAAVAEELVAACEGNPLGLVELPRLLSDLQRRGLEPLPSPLEAGPLVRAAFARRAQGLSDDARGALLLFAAAGEGNPALISTAVLDELETTGLVTRTGSVAFRHPLMRAAVYGEATPQERRAAHETLAVQLEGPRRAWHLAAAAAGPDEAIAGELERAAAEAGAQGGAAAQGEALQRAAALTPADGERARRMLQAARAWRRAGLIERAERLLAEALPLAQNERVRGEIKLEQGLDLLRRGAPHEAYDLLLAAASRAEQSEPEIASRLYASLTFVANIHPEAPPALPPAERALELSGRRGDAIELESIFAVVTARFRRPVPPDAEDEALVGRAAELLERSELRTGEQPHWFAYTLAELERDTEARELSDLALGENRAAGDVWSLCYGRFARAVLETVSGRVDAASAWVAEAVPLAEQIGEVWRLEQAAAVRQEVGGLRGIPDECGEDLHLGRALLGTGRPEEAIPVLERAAEAAGRGMPRSWLRLVPLELAEAYALAGRARDAEVALRAIAPAIEGCALMRPKARLTRVRGLLAAEARIDATFAQAGAFLDERPHLHEGARLELNWGERLRRAGRSTDAVSHLEHALTRFDALGCPGWAGRARRELEATGASARPAQPRRTDDLTAQELRIARHAAAGMRDREIAAALYLSPRTVESHLQHAYRKLGAANRTQLAAILAAEGVRPAGSVTAIP
jgi:DNA-binding CsgD family transcriptional regulator